MFSYLRSGRHLGSATGLGISLGLTQLPSLPMGTRASELWAQEAVIERGDELSAETGQQEEILGAVGDYAYNWSDSTWLDNKHSSIFHTHAQ